MQETNLDTTTSLLLSEYTDDDDDSVSSGSYEDIEEEDLLRLRELERKQISVNEQEEDFWFLFFLFAVFVIGSVLIFYYIFNSGNVTNGNNNRRRWGMQERRHHQRVKDSVYHLSVTLKDLYMGVPDKKMTIERQIVCSSCNDCPDCDNHRMEKESQRDFFSGRIFHTCFCNYHVSLPVHVKKGMQHDDLIRLDGEGNRHPSAYNGDVVFQLKSSNFYGNFQRFDGIHLKTTITISLKEALLGFRREIKHIDSHVVTIERKGIITQHNDVIVMSNEGMPIKDNAKSMMFGSSTHGNLHVTVLLRFPSKLSTAILKEFEKLF